MLVVAVLKSCLGLKTMTALGAVLTATFFAAFSFSRIDWLICVLVAAVGGSFVPRDAAAGAALRGDSVAEVRSRVSRAYGPVAYVGMFPLGGLLLGALSDIASSITPARGGSFLSR